jgi:hemerythrin-like domain-containing protein
VADDAIEVLIAEHAVLRGLLDEAQKAAAAAPPDPAVLGTAAEAFHARLTHHERCEEEVLFPALAGMGPVQLVQEEHSHLNRLRDALERALADVRADPSEAHCAALKRSVEEVAYSLAGHLMKEEQLVFRMAQAMLGSERLKELGARMQAIP